MEQLKLLSEQYSFNTVEVTNELIMWIKSWFKCNGNDCNAIIGISGGKDSTIAAKLCVEALGKDRVIGILLPNGDPHDFQTSIDVCEYLEIKYIVCNIEMPFHNIMEDMEDCLSIPSIKVGVSEQTKINIAPRLRMLYLRAFAQSLNGRLINTSNLSEDWVGYATIDGDTCGDMSPLSYLTVTEVKQIGHYLEIPDKFVEKVPEDGLVGVSDEENLGIKYSEIDDYIRKGAGEESVIKKIKQKFLQNEFKRQYTKGLPKYLPDLWNLYTYDTEKWTDYPPCVQYLYPSFIQYHLPSILIK